MQVEPSLVPWSPQLPWQNCPAQLPSQAQEPAAHEPAARAASMSDWFPRPEQPHSVSQNGPMKLPAQAQAEPSLVPVLPAYSAQFPSQNSPAQLPSQSHEPAAQEFASRAAPMAVWLPCPEQPHSTSQNCPMKLPSQAQVELAASYVPCSQSLQRASTLLPQYLTVCEPPELLSWLDPQLLPGGAQFAENHAAPSAVTAQSVLQPWPAITAMVSASGGASA